VGQIGYIFNLILTFPIFNGLIVLDRLFGDFGLAILVLTLIIKLVLFPLTLQQLKSTKATQSLQPQMAEINKKYASDQQAKAAALQTLYKEYGVNPLAGCLPLFIQLPVLYGLYFALRTGLSSSKLSDLNSHLYPFVPHFTIFPNVSFDWFTWLSFLNPILHLDWSWAFPLNSPDPSHILPIVAGLATFLQLRMSLLRRPPVTDGKPAAVDPTQQSMKMMQYIMPFFTVFIAWNVPSGLALYWTISSIFQAVQQYFVTGWGGLSTASLAKKEVSGTSSPVTTRLSQRSNATTSRVTSRSTSVVESTLVDSGEARIAGAGAGAGSVNTSSTSNAPKSNGNGSASGGSQYTRRQRGSASARRRGGAQRAR
jgi:YidC/Oxa1 family membrane protein insertase